MLKIFIIVILCLLTGRHWTQEQNTVIQLPEFYEGQGVIFKDKEDVYLSIKDTTNFYVPTAEEIKISESIFQKDYKQLLQNTYINLKNKYNLSYSDKRAWEKTINNVNVFRQYKYYNRQYAGFKNKENEKIIVMRLLNFRNAKLAKENFNNWKEELVIGFGSFYEKNTKLLFINIDKKNILNI